MQLSPQLVYPLHYPNFVLSTCSQLQPWHLPFFLPKENTIDNMTSSISFVSKNLDQENSSEASPREFTSHSQPCIILTSKKVFSSKKVKQSKASQYEEKIKMVKKPPQKETRNVTSNLLRIFLKNLLEIKLFDQTIQRVLIRNESHYSLNQFYSWLQSFNINFKNYIKTGEIKKIVGKEQPEVFKRLFILLLKRYAGTIGISHVLTSRRIEKSSIKMHIRGLQDLLTDVLTFYIQQKE